MEKREWQKVANDWKSVAMDERNRRIAAEKQIDVDVARMVVAARVVAFEDQSPEAIKALDKASEAFASRVPWDKQS